MTFISFSYTKLCSHESSYQSLFFWGISVMTLVLCVFGENFLMVGQYEFDIFL